MKRTFICGDKWLYYKIYCGTKTADYILTETIKPITEILLSKGLIDSWFYIRYYDSDNHLRWRLKIKNKNVIGEVINSINESFYKYIENRQIHNIQIDTYKREVERYGINSIEFSEELFYYESKMIASFLDLIDGEEGEEIRWLFSMKAVDQMLTDFRLDYESKFSLLEMMAFSFEKEFNADSNLIKQLSEKYRSKKKRIWDFLTTDLAETEYEELKTLIETKSSESYTVVNEILSIKNKKELQIDFENLLSSYIHMLMNRLFRANQRLHEMVIYGFLTRFYKTVIARKKYN
jgi:thiopeptide-type bacteriocin biosynthesis protein